MLSTYSTHEGKDLLQLRLPADLIPGTLWLEGQQNSLLGPAKPLLVLPDDTAALAGEVQSLLAKLGDGLRDGAEEGVSAEGLLTDLGFITAFVAREHLPGSNSDEQLALRTAARLLDYACDEGAAALVDYVLPLARRAWAPGSHATPLHRAVRSGNTAVIRTLLESGRGLWQVSTSLLHGWHNFMCCSIACRWPGQAC